jgi:hypothetical protein
MENNITQTLEERMAALGERPVLLLRRIDGERVFRYGVGMAVHPPTRYSIYAEYRAGELHTITRIPAFSSDRDTAESFCSLLERVLATPLSLEAIYEDSLTP